MDYHEINEMLEKHRESCHEIIKATYAKKPSPIVQIGTIIATLGVLVGTVVAYWAKESVQDQFKTATEINISAVREKNGEQDKRLENLEKIIPQNQEMIMKELRALRDDISYKIGK